MTGVNGINFVSYLAIIILYALFFNDIDKLQLSVLYSFISVVSYFALIYYKLFFTTNLRCISCRSLFRSHSGAHPYCTNIHGIDLFHAAYLLSILLSRSQTILFLNIFLIFAQQRFCLVKNLHNVIILCYNYLKTFQESTFVHNRKHKLTLTYKL